MFPSSVVLFIGLLLIFINGGRVFLCAGVSVFKTDYLQCDLVCLFCIVCVRLCLWMCVSMFIYAL